MAKNLTVSNGALTENSKKLYLQANSSFSITGTLEDGPKTEKTEEFSDLADVTVPLVTSIKKSVLAPNQFLAGVSLRVSPRGDETRSARFYTLVSWHWSAAADPRLIVKVTRGAVPSNTDALTVTAFVVTMDDVLTFSDLGGGSSSGGIVKPGSGGGSGGGDAIPMPY